MTAHVLVYHVSDNNIPCLSETTEVRPSWVSPHQHRWSEKSITGVDSYHCSRPAHATRRLGRLEGPLNWTCCNIGTLMTWPFSCVILLFPSPVFTIRGRRLHALIHYQWLILPNQRTVCSIRLNDPPLSRTTPIVSCDCKWCQRCWCWNTNRGGYSTVQNTNR